jgi:tetratricopeptide (TPR) repeat protein
MGRIGQRFGIATPETSLLVLETVEDYVQYDILPPQELRAEFTRLKAGRDRDQRTSRQDYLDAIAEEYADRIEWWSKSWPKGKPPVERDRKRRRSELAMVAPAPTSASEEGSTSLDRIEVTGSRITAADLYGTVSIQPWQPDSPYARRLRAAAPDRIYAIYLDERDSYADSSAFFLDVADILFENKQPELALRVLSNLAEMDMENRHLLRVLGYRLMQAERPDLAVPVFERVLRISEEEPQSFRDLGLAYAGDRQYQRAIDTLYEVVQRDWDFRFGGITMITLAEMNAIIATSGQPLDTQRMDRRLLKNLPVGLRTVLSWDSDNSDMDLWVTDPNGEKCFYGHQSTYQGGRISEDFTGGYGPEEFVLRKPKPGKYKVEANYYGDDELVLTGATTLSLWLSTGFGTGHQHDRKVVLRLKDAKETVLVGEFEIK